jgi:hypothetical protein
MLGSKCPKNGGKSGLKAVNVAAAVENVPAPIQKLAEMSCRRLNSQTKTSVEPRTKIPLNKNKAVRGKAGIKMS